MKSFTNYVRKINPWNYIIFIVVLAVVFSHYIESAIKTLGFHEMLLICTLTIVIVLKIMEHRILSAIKKLHEGKPPST